MNFKILICSIFLFKLMFVNCLLIKNNKIIFKSNKIIQINGNDHKELDCNENFCKSIHEVTCKLNRSRSINSCLITNLDTLYFNETIPNEYIICDDNNRLKCYIKLVSSINLNLSNTENQSDVVYSNLMDQILPDLKDFNSKPIDNNQKIDWDDDFNKRQKNMERQANFIMIGFMIIFGSVFLLIITAICRGCCAEAGFDPCSCCNRDTAIISESARRISFPRNNYAITTQANLQQTPPNYPTMNPATPQYNPSFNNAFNESVVEDKNSYTEPPPSYDQINFAANQGTTNSGYMPNSLQNNYASPNYMLNTTPSAPSKF